MATDEKELIGGYHALRELLARDASALQEVWLQEGKKSGRAREVIALAEDAGVPVYFKSKRQLSALLPGVNHQGFVGIGVPFKYAGLEELLASRREGEGLIIALDHITDEGNLGSIIRTAAFFGVQGLIIPGKRSAKVSSKVMKLAAGAHLHVPICRVVNMARVLEKLEKRGYWIVGASGGGEGDIFEFDWKRNVVLILGNEQKGIGHAVKKKCHELVSIPGLGQVESLNVGVAAGVVLAEIFRQRRE